MADGDRPKSNLAEVEQNRPKPKSTTTFIVTNLPKLES